MLKKTITYEDYFGTVRTEDFYFNLSKQELSDMQMSVDGGYKAYLEKILNAVNNKEVYKTFVDIVLAAYGEISPDGKYHLKEDEHGNKLYKKFRQSPAYDALMDEICKNEGTIAEFCKGILPKSMQEDAEKAFTPQDHKRPEHLKAYDPNQDK